MCLDHADNAWRAVGARGDLAIAATLSITGAATSLPDLPPPQLSDAGEHPYGAAGGEGRVIPDTSYGSVWPTVRCSFTQTWERGVLPVMRDGGE